MAHKTVGEEERLWFLQGMETHPRILPISVEQNQVLILLEMSQSDLREGKVFVRDLGPTDSICIALLPIQRSN